MQIANTRLNTASSSINWLSTATTYVVAMAALAAFVFFSVDETRALLFG
tara:strand:- start:59 stop:205 length:147 start_codon:yes stop_codon:yes gene_type:complete